MAYRGDKVENRANSVTDINQFAHHLHDPFSWPRTALGKYKQLGTSGLPIFHKYNNNVMYNVQQLKKIDWYWISTRHDLQFICHITKIH